MKFDNNDKTKEFSTEEAFKGDAVAANLHKSNTIKEDQDK